MSAHSREKRSTIRGRDVAGRYVPDEPENMTTDTFDRALAIRSGRKQQLGEMLVGRRPDPDTDLPEAA